MRTRDSAATNKNRVRRITDLILVAVFVILFPRSPRAERISSGPSREPGVRAKEMAQLYSRDGCEAAVLTVVGPARPSCGAARVAHRPSDGLSTRVKSACALPIRAEARAFRRCPYPRSRRARDIGETETGLSMEASYTASEVKRAMASYGPPITTELAKKVAGAALAEARRNKW